MKAKSRAACLYQFPPAKIFFRSKFVSSLKEKREVSFVKRILCLGLDESKVGGILEAAAAAAAAFELTIIWRVFRFVELQAVL